MNVLVKALVLTISAALATETTAADVTSISIGNADTVEMDQKRNGQMYPDNVVLRNIYELAFQSGRLDANLYVKNAPESLLQSTYSYLLESGLKAQPENMNYPTEKVMVEIYLQMLGDKHFQAGTGPVSPNLTNDVLERTFEMALALGIVDSFGYFQDPSMARSSGTGIADFTLSQNKWNWSAACKGAVASCAVTAGAAAYPVIRACGAAAMQEGLNYASDADCAAALAGVATKDYVAVGTTCGNMFAQCTHRDNPAVYETTVIGVQSGTREKRFCSSTSRVHSVELRRNLNSSTIRGLRISCSSGATQSFGSQSGGTSVVQVCSNDLLVGGLRVSTNANATNIASIGTLCDKVARNANETGDTQQFQQFGQSISSLVQRNCLEHQYVVGLETWSANGVVNGLRVLCN